MGNRHEYLGGAHLIIFRMLMLVRGYLYIKIARRCRSLIMLMIVNAAEKY